MQRQVLAVLRQDYSDSDAGVVPQTRFITEQRQVPERFPTAFRLPTGAVAEFHIFPTCSCHARVTRTWTLGDLHELPVLGSHSPRCTYVSPRLPLAEFPSFCVKVLSQPFHSVELNHALSQAGGPTQFQLSRPMSSRRHVFMEHRLRRKHLQLNFDANSRSGIYLEKKKRRNTIFQKKEKKKWENEKDLGNE